MYMYGVEKLGRVGRGRTNKTCLVKAFGRFLFGRLPDIYKYIAHKNIGVEYNFHMYDRL